MPKKYKQEDINVSIVKYRTYIAQERERERTRERQDMNEQISSFLAHLQMRQDISNKVVGGDKFCMGQIFNESRKQKKHE